MSQQGHKEKQSIFISISYLANFILILSSIIFLFIEYIVDEEELFACVLLVMIALLNIFTINKHCVTSNDNLPNIINLYFKRKKLEEEQKIKELEKS